MRFYEIIFILRQDVQEQEVESKIAPLINIIENNGGSLVLKERWGLRSLAYEIRKNKRGCFVMLVVEATSEAVNEIGNHCKFSEDIIRFLVVRVDKPSSEPSFIMQQQKVEAKDRFNKDKFNKDKVETKARAEKQA